MSSLKNLDFCQNLALKLSPSASDVLYDGLWFISIIKMNFNMYLGMHSCNTFLFTQLAKMAAPRSAMFSFHSFSALMRQQKQGYAPPTLGLRRDAQMCVRPRPSAFTSIHISLRLCQTSFTQ